MPLYFLSLLLYASAIFAKESLLTFLPVFALGAWLATPRLDRPLLGRLSIALFPFAALLALQAYLRLSSWGHLGGYGRTPTNFGEVLPLFWERIITPLRLLLSPINSTLLGSIPAQIVGAVTMAALLTALVLVGHRQAPLLLVSAAWLLLALVPVLSLPVKLDDLQQNRFLYLASAGYCTGVAALLYAAISRAHRLRSPAIAGIGVLLLLSIVTCWVQLRPWYVAATQAARIEETVNELIPPASTAGESVWYAENIPDNYKGAYILRQGLGITRYFINGVRPTVVPVPDARQAPLATERQDAFALRFNNPEGSEQFEIDYLAGITRDDSPPSSSSTNDNDRVVLWDFRQCPPEAVSRWQAVNSRATCQPGKGLAIEPDNADPQMINVSLDASLKTEGARYLRLRVAATYSPASNQNGTLAQWFWIQQGGTWREEKSTTFPIKQDGTTYTYWAFAPLDAGPQEITGLRFDPANAQVSAIIEWIAIDPVR